MAVHVTDRSVRVGVAVAVLLACGVAVPLPVRAQAPAATAAPVQAGSQGAAPVPTDANTSLHLLRPDYPVPYGAPTVAQVTEVLERIRGYLEANTPSRLVDRSTGRPVTDYSRIDDNTVLEPGAFRMVSYEWGVTYGGMLLAHDATGDPAFRDYVAKRLKLIADIAPIYRARLASRPDERGPVHSVLEPRALDDAGSMCAAMIKALRAGVAGNMRPLVDNYVQYILTKEFRLPDGTLARNRPQPSTLWLDDLYMSVPALAQMGALTGESKYFDEGTRQIRQFAARMFRKDQGLFMHGWVAGMEVPPEFYWARANGWALMTLVEVLDVLPEAHGDRPMLLELLRAHVRGLLARQSGSGFWHQLLDREDSYLETSATAIYAYAMARAINRGWLDPVAHGPAVVLAWNAVATKVNAEGQVEGTCVGTGMGFDPAFYYHRPVSKFAAHGYGPTLLAGAEIIRLLKSHRLEINDSALQLYR
jgi:rhamnogalacturonyl hydrolase YesR